MRLKTVLLIPFFITLAGVTPRPSLAAFGGGAGRECCRGSCWRDGCCLPEDRCSLIPTPPRASLMGLEVESPVETGCAREVTGRVRYTYPLWNGPGSREDDERRADQDATASCGHPARRIGDYEYRDEYRPPRGLVEVSAQYCCDE